MGLATFYNVLSFLVMASVQMKAEETQLNYCQERQALDWQDRGYEARSRRPSSPVRLYPSTVGLGFRKETGDRK